MALNFGSVLLSKKKIKHSMSKSNVSQENSEYVNCVLEKKQGQIRGTKVADVCVGAVMQKNVIQEYYGRIDVS